ncbi:hypothetical protein [Mycobacteroides abscessus]|uniref:hypothetical protein n=1 Tax=Mycobacteroides abscessus TaxID=36809 RepID=UPI00092A8526|nr:hypothetical protein [Mycobacteroides abscessus]SHQ46765.1 Uncharacterised protein [Mycobacteroides abscessus subsp. abscessus]SKQ86639.1 Uncharacterised protein [Mycobacteroides abscessus subsp. massiliense]SLC48018.1 Uncharacterised protein [Mycobacteroides abscessus subsp. massiliense]
MNTCEDGTEPLGEAPADISAQRAGGGGFVPQQIPLVLDGKTTTVQVLAQTTECPYLVITPVVGYSEDGTRAIFCGPLSLTHTPTGTTLANSHSSRGLEKLADALKGFDWDFSEREHFNRPENADMANAVRETVRQWQIAEGDYRPVALWGDDEEKRAAREREPAMTLLREQLDWWAAQSQSIHDRDLMNTNKEAWLQSVSSSVSGWGMTYLLAVLQRIAPDVADIAARRLVAEFEAGDSMGEWIFQWSRELGSGLPLSLHGIPDPDPLAEFAANA